MNPRTTDSADSAARHLLDQRCMDCWYRMVSDFPLDVLKAFVETIEQLEQDYRRASVTLDPLAYQPSRNGTDEREERPHE